MVPIIIIKTISAMVDHKAIIINLDNSHNITKETIGLNFILFKKIIQNGFQSKKQNTNLLKNNIWNIWKYNISQIMSLFLGQKKELNTYLQKDMRNKQTISQLKAAKQVQSIKINKQVLLEEVQAIMAKTTICKCKVLFNLNLARIASGLKINKCTQFNSHKDIIITSIKIRTTNTSIIHTYNKEIIQI